MMARVMIVFLLCCFVSPLVRAEDPVCFPDAELKRAMENNLWTSDPTPTDMLGLTSLTCVQNGDNQENGIRSLTGLEYILNLRALNLRLNQISSISLPSGLTRLA